MSMMKRIQTSEFVRRQTPESKFDHFAGTWEEVEDLTEANFDKAKQGYRDGVVLVPVPADGFFSGVVEVTEGMALVASLVRRLPEEEPYIDVLAPGQPKLPAKTVDIVLYRHDVLMEGNEASCDAEWEIISVNASPIKGDVPMHPVAMMRNMMVLPGGTAATYTAEQFCEAIRYWSTRAMAG
jgi:hypothetical protein